MVNHSFYIYSALIFTLFCLSLSLIWAILGARKCRKAIRYFYQQNYES